MSSYTGDLLWRDYHPESMAFIENWLDSAAVSFTGLDEGFRAFYEYWANEEGFDAGVNFWCKVICEADQPFAVIAFCLHEQKIVIMEIVVAPEKRGCGFGTKLLKELLERKEILGFVIQESEAVIFPGNLAS